MNEIKKQNKAASLVTNEEMRIALNEWVERGKDRRGDKTYPCSDRVDRRRSERRGK